MKKPGQFPAEQGTDGSFQRQEDVFREKLSADGSSPWPVEKGRYHLYLSLACPWAHRAYLFLRFCGLQDWIGTTVVDPVRDEKGWAFRDGDGFSKDPVNGFQYLAEAYEMSHPEYFGRITVPTLWCKKEKRIVNNSEDDLCFFFNKIFPGQKTDFFPADRAEEHQTLANKIYENVNNGVYRAGFATKQQPYEKAVLSLFKTLDDLEEQLSDGRSFLLGENQVEADWRLFCTLIRFDAVYVGHFKCNLRRIADYPWLSLYLKRLYEFPGVAETVRLDHIKDHYYKTHPEINPSRIVPLGPDVSFK
ncbi:MAG: glutathione S-transferase C-terminal domain-containing protein [Opitutales bacterium]|nr:glutathione S-transferase C-terminal domain-containing protein [Opitutales bacterium]